MKKSIRVIVAMMLVVLFAVAMIPAASAAGEKLVIKNDSTDFSFDIYKVATLSDTATGKYTVASGVDSTISAAVNTANQNGAAFLAVLDAVTDTSKLGTFVANVTAKDEGTTEKEITEAGIYYARVKDKPAGDNVAKVKNSVIVWPEYRGGAWQYDQTAGAYTVDLGTKVGTDRVTKSFSDTASDTKSAGQGDVIQFTLKADIVGNASDLATKYQIWDKMSPGLEYVANSAHVYYDGTTTSADSDFTIATPEKINDTADAKYNGGTKFEFSAKAAVLADKDSAYYDHKEVYVTYSATVLNAAGIGKDYNPNKDGLVYKLESSAADVERAGREVKVYTYAAEVTKIDASATAKAVDGVNVPLAGAVIGLYTKNTATNALTEIARGTSQANGKVVFKNGSDANALRLAPGEYVVKEISAPNGYALSTVEYPLTIIDDNTARQGNGMFRLDGDKVVENFATKMPETGGQGTLMFTLIGAGLILCAGILFVIIMKKRTVK